MASDDVGRLEERDEFREPFYDLERSYEDGEVWKVFGIEGPLLTQLGDRLRVDERRDEVGPHLGGFAAHELASVAAAHRQHGMLRSR